jgi:hypothetical protein
MGANALPWATRAGPVDPPQRSAGTEAWRGVTHERAGSRTSTSSTGARSALRPSGQTPFQIPGHRWAVAVAATHGPDGPALSVAIADPAGHPFDLGPMALLDTARVEDLHTVLGNWLDAHRPGDR